MKDKEVADKYKIDKYFIDDKYLLINRWFNKYTIYDM